MIGIGLTNLPKCGEDPSSRPHISSGGPGSCALGHIRMSQDHRVGGNKGAIFDIIRQNILPFVLTFRRACTIDFYDDNNSSAAKDDSNTAGGAQSLQRMDSAPAFFLLFKLLGKVFRTMTITKGLWGRATLTMDQKFEIGTPLMRNFLFFSFPSFFLLSFFYCHLILMFALLWDFHSKD